jgi:hypothetical protein
VEVLIDLGAVEGELRRIKKGEVICTDWCYISDWIWLVSTIIVMISGITF